mmetsp:Transcript_32504/g.31750  ORF Transcript_32504/g.31750 Transcript_32504/m.31750 type:complete len:91 (-) Transcript_32504:2065-2337(-)
MGPLADLKFDLDDNDGEQKVVKWVDNGEMDKTKLVTNKSEEDLLCKEEVEAIITHRSSSQVKATLKPFLLNLEEVTGVLNISENIKAISA